MNEPPKPQDQSSVKSQPPAKDSTRPIEEIIASKKAKLQELRGRGIDPYPIRVVFDAKYQDYPFVQASKVLDSGSSLAPQEQTDKIFKTAGRVTKVRVMGKVIFFDLVDSSGKVQIYIRDTPPDQHLFALVRDFVQIGDFVGVCGALFKTKTGEITLWTKDLILLAKALRPMPEKWHGLKDIETRFRQRHLDLIANPEVLANFRKRSLIISTIRRVFDSLGFVEVETPVLLPQAGGASATPFHTFHNALDQEMVLRIATELYLKRLIIGGFDKVYEIGRIFRNEGIDTSHNPEFTMLEAYQAYADYEEMASLFERVVAVCAETLDISEVEYAGHTISLKPPFRRIRLPEAWRETCGEPIEDVLKGISFNRKRLCSLAERLGIASENVPSAKIFDHIMDEKILPRYSGLTFVFDYPAAVTTLAKLKPGSQVLVERFECFAAGQEFANAYSELNDPQDQDARFTEQLLRPREEGGTHREDVELPDEDFVEALECGMPPTGGIGIGIDRLVMLLTGQESIREVILFPTLKSEEKENKGHSES